MRITIKDCLALPVFENAEILACEENTEKSIKKISVLETSSTDDIKKYYSDSEQLIVTGFFGIGDDEQKQCDIVKALALSGTVALVVHRVGDVVSNVSETLIESCKKYGIVLIALNSSKDKRVSDIIEEVSQKLFYGNAADKSQNNLITNTILHLLNFDKYTDFQNAVKAAAINNGFQLVLLSTDFNPIFTVETQYKTTVEKAVKMARENAVDKKRSIYTTITVEGVLTYWGTLTIADNNYYMLIVDNEDLYSKDDIIKLADIIKMAIGMWKYTPAVDQKAELIKALRRGNLNVATALKEEVGVEDKYILGVFIGEGASLDESLDAIENYCVDNHMQVMHIAEDDEIFGVITGDCKVSVCSKLYEEAKSKYCKLFHITGIDGMEGACDGFKLINETWSQATLVFPYKKTFSKYDLILINDCNQILSNGGFIKKYYLKLLEPFNAETSIKGKQLLETLETFVLDAGMSSNKTAEIMNLHNNTIQYRLKKMSELLGVEITANRVIPGLTIALALRRLEMAP